MITLDGYQALDVVEKLEQYDALDEDGRFSWLHPTFWAGKANSYRTQHGTAPARGYVLLRHSDWEKIKAKLDLGTSAATPTGTNHFHLIFDDGNGGRVDIPAAVIVGSRLVAKGVEADGDGCRLVEVSDARWLYAQPTRMTAEALNVRLAGSGYPAAAGGVGTGYDDTTIPSPNLAAWSTLITDLGSFAGVESDRSTDVLSDRHGNPDDFHFVGEPQLRALVAVLFRLGAVFTCDPLSAAEGYAFFRLGATSAAYDAAVLKYRGRLLFDDENFDTFGESVRDSDHISVGFTRFNVDQAAEFQQSASATPWRQVATFHVSVNAAGTVTESGVGGGALWDDLRALSTAADDNDTWVPDNLTDLEDRAKERAASYFRWRQLKDVARVYSGIISDVGFLPNEQVSGIAWRAVGTGYVTEIAAGRDMLLPDDDGWRRTDYPVPSLAPPDLGRRSWANFPPRTAMIDVGADAGETVAGGTLYNATLSDPIGGVTGDAVYALSLAGPIAPTVPLQGFLSRLHNNVPTYIVQCLPCSAGSGALLAPRRAAAGTPAPGGGPAPCCGELPPLTPAEQRDFEWVATAQLTADAVRLAALLPPDAAGVVGVPRSGMLPATVIAAHLQLPLYELNGGEPHRLGHGCRGRGYGFPTANGGPLVVVDDTVYDGHAMRAARHQLGGRAVYAAVYVRPGAERFVDHFVRHLESPHLLEWNMLNGGPVAGHSSDPVYGAGIATDLDGVLLHDAHSGGTPGTPYLLSRAAVCPLIVSGRRERHREQTEAELRRWGVRWARLELYPDAAPDGDVYRAEHKAAHYERSGCGFFVESCPHQAAWVADATGRPVICPRLGRVLHRRPVLVPRCPDLGLTPHSPRAVVTVAAGAEGKELLGVTGPFLAAYARRVGADLVVLDWQGHADWPMSAKYALPRAVERYERTLYVDADVLLGPDCPDLFGLVSPGHLAARVEYGVHRAGGDWLERDYGRWAAALGLPADPPETYFNAGVMLLERAHAPLLEPPAVPVRPTHAAEQHGTNHAVRAAGVPFFALPRECNWMEWCDDHAQAPAGAVLHFSGFGPRRLDELRRAASRYLMHLAQP